MSSSRKWLAPVIAVALLVASVGLGSETAQATMADGSGAGLFFSLPAGSTHTVQLWTWSGQPDGEFTTGPVAECCSTVSASPNGRRIAILKGQGAEIVNDRGMRLGAVSAGGTWADDNQHLCAIQARPPTQGHISSSGSLLLARAGQKPQLVKTGVGGYGPHAQSDIGWCSIRHDRAVIFANFAGMNAGVEIVQLSTGKALHPAWQKTPVTSWVAVSGDGRYVVAVPSGGGGEVIDAGTGKVVGTVPIQPVGISWQGHVVVGTSDNTGQDMAIDWVTGKTIWVSNPPVTQGPEPIPSAVLAQQPGTDTLAVVVTNTLTDTPPHASLWLFGPGVTPKLLSNQVQEGEV